VRLVAPFALVWCAVFVFSVVLLLHRLVIVRDEVWMLWLAQRLAKGDVLYRDAYDVTTPLAAWLAAGVVRLTGPQMAAMRAIAAAVFATQVLLAMSIVRCCGMRREGRVVLLLGLLACGAPYAAWVSLYSALAVLFGIGALRAVLWWRDAFESGAERLARWAAAVVGATSALAFWSKPNVGVFVCSAVGVTIVAAVVTGGPERRRALGEAGWIGLGAVGVSLAFVAAIVATGAWPAFVDQVFRSKSEYVDAGFSYMSQLDERFDAVFGEDQSSQLRHVVRLVIQIAPPLLVAGTAAGAYIARRADRTRVVGLAAFALAALLSVFPRPGLNHITGVIPLALPAVAGLFGLASRRDLASRARRARLLALAAIGLLAVIGIVAVATPLVAPNQPERIDRGADHFALTSVARRQLEASARLRGELRDRGIDRVFIVRKDAGFLYLRTGTTNPLPYDIPERSDFGGDGEQGVIRRIAAGEAEWVCIRKPGAGSRSHGRLVPRHLEDWVRTNLEPKGEVARCDLYRAPASRPARTASATAS
jgi:hypothetical protein